MYKDYGAVCHFFGNPAQRYFSSHCTISGIFLLLFLSILPIDKNCSMWYNGTSGLGVSEALAAVL